MDHTKTNPHGRRAHAALLAASALFLGSLAVALPRPAGPEVPQVPKLGWMIAAQGNAALQALKQEAREAVRVRAWPRDLHVEGVALAAAP